MWIPYIIFMVRRFLRQLIILCSFLKNTDLNEAVTLDGADSTVFVTREGNFTRAGIDFVDETEIFEGRDNKITMVQTYSKSFHCSYLLHSFPFDTQVFFVTIFDVIYTLGSVPSVGQPYFIFYMDYI